MKKLLCLLLLVAISVSAAACGNDEQTEITSQVSSETESSVAAEDNEPKMSEEYAHALKLIDEGKIKDCYAYLYNLDDGIDAKELLDDFKVVAQRLHVVHDSLYFDSSISDYEYTYDDKGELLSTVIISETATITYENIKNYDHEGRLIEEAELVSNGDYRDYRDYKKWEYDEQGNLIVEDDGLPNDDYYDHHEHTYDEKNRKTSTYHYSYSAPDGESESMTTYKYDEKNRVIEEVIDYIDDYYWSDSISEYTRVIKYTYDDNDNILTQTITRGDKTLSKTESTYDSNGLLISELWVHEDGQQTLKELIYHENGKIKESKYTYKSKSGVTSNYSIYTYDEEEFLEKEISVSSTLGNTTKIWSKGNILEETVEKNGEITSKKIYTYNEHGDLTLVENKIDGSSTEYRYEYYKNGLLKKKSYYLTYPHYDYYEYDELGNIIYHEIEDGGYLTGYLDRDEKTYSDFLYFYCPKDVAE